MTQGLNRQLLRLTTLLQLEQRARRARLEELGFVMVNETSQLIAYHHAVLWHTDGRFVAVSGVAVPDPNGPFLTFLRRLIIAVNQGPRSRALHSFTAADWPDFAPGWAEVLPAYLLWVPLIGPDDTGLGALVFARSEPWTEGDVHLLEYLGGAYAHAWMLAAQKPRRRLWQRRRWIGRLRVLCAIAAVAGLGVLPVNLSVLAPAEIVPRAPTLVRAPFDGVIDTVLVEPNQPVAVGEPLVTLNTDELKARLVVAQKARDIVQAEYGQAGQLALTDPKAKGRLAVLQSRVEQEAAEVAYLRGLLDRAAITAPEAGIAVVDDTTDWVGRPVVLGERLLLIADPHRIDLEIQLPASEGILFSDGAPVELYLNVAPDAPEPARLTFVSYRALPMPDGILAYRLRARFEAPSDRLRLGLKGTAKIYGPRGPLALMVLRRPLITVRQWLGW